MKIGDIYKLTYEGLSTIRRVIQSKNNKLLLINDYYLRVPIGQDYDLHELKERFIDVKDTQKYEIEYLGNTKDISKKLFNKYFS